MADTNSGWDGRGASDPGGAPDPEAGPDPVAGRCAGGRPRGRRVAAASLVALAALATGCEPGTAEGAQEVAPPARATRAAPPAPSPFLTAPAPTPAAEDAKPSAAPPPGPSASTAAPAPTRARPKPPAPSTAPPPRVLMRTGSESDRVRELQARLRQIGHFGRNPTGYYGSVTADAVRSFQAKRRLPVTGSTDAVTWQRLLAMTRVPTAEELDPPTERPLAAPDERCLKGRVLCISKESRTLAWMRDGKVLSAMDVRFGSEYTPTREGVFEVFWKSRDHVSTLYDTPMPYALFFSGGQAVHYSADFAANGYGGASHGCVNVRDKKKVAALFDQVKNGDKVVVYS
ncbi:Putative peptidoglycan-binding domain-containing protein [Streptomyces sp. MnatMP-M77]|uniref:L,D-transpeptidase family protein n=1 Tax=unclassified Streptomyces TaxID=2593676 RepID=UPI000805FE8B|nr:L,D-transpeptidase family protein [Streptomyces sp. MnatMP-M77]MYT80821.1 L,D-transpeptidase family protein [Streptomyces sp. SID8364]SBV01174.1 Putative peptidoglycan-binding domain-containing protein [Streptomyces sp. MnatMP-M77]